MMMKVLCSAGAGTLCVFTAVQGDLTAEEPENERLPNIIFVLADDLGIGDLSCYGQKRYATPHLDEMAQTGVLFTSFYSTFPVSAPARCSILTGKHAGHCGIRNNGEINPEGQTPMPKGDPTLAEMLKNQGYATACIGKWGLGPAGSEGDPNKRGFDLFYGVNCQRQAHHYYPTHVWRNRQREDLKGNKLSHGFSYLPDLLEKEAHAFIRQNKDKPFFLWYTTPLPHASLTVKDSELARFKGKFPEPKPFKGGNGGYDSQPFPRAAAAAMNVRIDDEVGRLRALVKELGVFENTIFVFASDNGPSPEGGKDVAFFNSTLGDRKSKGSLFNGGVHVPFMVSCPGIIEPSVCDEPFAFFDLFPTFGELAEVKAVPVNDGVSLLPVLTGNPSMQKQHDEIYWEFGGFGGQVAVRLGDWKGVAENLHSDTQINFQLFDIKADPGELKNVAAEYPEMIKLMNDAIHEHRETPVIKAFDIPLLKVQPQEIR